jgi:hypothetical protein
VIDRIEELQERIRVILKTAQTGDARLPATPVQAQPEQVWWPQGYAIDELIAQFGGVLHHRADGTTRRMGFDARGVISNAWVARGVAEQLTVRRLPPPRDWWSHPIGKGDQVDLVTFSTGWLLVRPARDVAWRWVV